MCFRTWYQLLHNSATKYNFEQPRAWILPTGIVCHLLFNAVKQTECSSSKLEKFPLMPRGANLQSGGKAWCIFSYCERGLLLIQYKRWYIFSYCERGWQRVYTWQLIKPPINTWCVYFTKRQSTVRFKVFSPKFVTQEILFKVHITYESS